jgi:MoaA/NifB/PqqE/SkfB family radical SAM enzyme
MEGLRVRYLTDYPRCNFSCEYCTAGHGSEPTAAVWDGGRYRRVLANLAQLPYRLSIRIGVAGEFFLDRDLVEGARELSSVGNVEALNLITNLSLPLAAYDRLLDGFRIEKVGLVASFHPSQVGDRESWLRTAEWMAAGWTSAPCWSPIPRSWRRYRD